MQLVLRGCAVPGENEFSTTWYHGMGSDMAQGGIGIIDKPIQVDSCYISYGTASLNKKKYFILPKFYLICVITLWNIKRNIKRKY